MLIPWKKKFTSLTRKYNYMSELIFIEKKHTEGQGGGKIQEFKALALSE